MEKEREFWKNIHFCFIDYEAFSGVDHNKLENSLRDGSTRLPYQSSEKLVCRSNIRTRHRTTEWSKIGKGIRQGCTLSSSCLFNLYAEYIIQNAWLNDSQAGINIVGRNINNLRYAYKSLSSQSCCISNSQVWMLMLDHKEG